MNKSIKKRLCVLCIVFLTVCLIGCGEKNRDALEEDMNQAGAEIGSSSDAQQGSAGAQTEKEDIPEHVTYELTSSDENGVAGVAKVDADVTASGYSQVGVYDVEMVEVDEAYLKELAEQIFDDGEYEIVKPYQACTMEELLAEQGYIKSLYAAAGIEEEDDLPFLWVEHYIEVYNETDMETWEDGQVMHDTQTTYYDSEGQPIIMSSKEAKLRGSVDGEVYQLEYEKNDGSYGSTQYLNLRRLCDKSGASTTFYKICDADDSLSVTLYGENACDRERTEQEACNIMEQMGFSDMEPVYTTQMIYNKDEGQYADGYSIIFARTVDGVQTVFCENSLAMFWDDYDRYMHEYNGDVLSYGAGQQYVMVNIDSTGFLGCTFNVFYRMGERLAGETGKLTFEQVCQVMESHLKGDGIAMAVAIQEIKMGYMTLRYEDKYVLAPVWVYLGKGTYDKIYAQFGVNALDGSIIYFGFSYGLGDMLWPNFN